MLAFCDGFFLFTLHNTYIHVLSIEWEVLRWIKNGLNKYSQFDFLKLLLLLVLQHAVFLFISESYTENSPQTQAQYSNLVIVRDFLGLYSYKIPRANRLINIVPLSFRCCCFFLHIFTIVNTTFYNKKLTQIYLWLAVSYCYAIL